MNSQKEAPDLAGCGGGMELSNRCNADTTPDNGAPSIRANFGALPGEWEAWQAVSAPDLLPVVSDPDAIISEFSKVKEPGKTPSDYNRRGEMRGLKDWTSYTSGSKDIAKWEKEPDYGICLQTRRFRAIDVDVEDFEESLDIESAILELLGNDVPIRRRPNSCKFLVLVEIPGELSKRRFHTKTPKSVIEFLANGQQCVVSGTHPSGARYVWERNGQPWIPAVQDIPKLTDRTFELLWEKLNISFGSEESVTVRAGLSPTKKRQIADMNDRLVDFLEDRGWVKDIDSSGRVDITCPWEHEHTTDSGDSATSYFPAGVGGIEQGHFRCQHAHCAGRTDQDFKNEIGWSVHGFDEIPDPPATSGAPLPLPAFTRLETGRDAGKIEATRNNLALALARPDICGHSLRFDTFLDAMMIGVNGKWREFVDEDYYAIAMRLEQGETAFKHIPADMLRECVKFTCRQNTFDTAQAWLNSLTWDGVPRVATFLSTFVGAADTPYTRAVSCYFWSALAGRVLVPGVKADMALIAVGEQGARKTSLVHALVPDGRFAGELDLSDERIEIARSMRGKLVMELGELSGFSKRSVEHLKAFISRQKEEWTPKFKEFTTTVHRRCLFFGTTNNEEILVDETGNRRWLPFHSAGANPEALAAVRNQLWAEGAALFGKHGVLWQDAERLAKNEHAEFTVSDVWDSAVYDWLYDPYERFTADGKTVTTTPAEWGFTVSEVLHGAVRLEVSKQTRAHETRVGRILKRLGFVKKQQRVPKNERDQSAKSDRPRIYRLAE